MTSKIGQHASARPSSTASIAYLDSMLQTPMPAASEMINAATHAFQGAIFIMARASTSHKIGDSASKNIKVIIPPYRRNLCGGKDHGLTPFVAYNACTME